MEFYDENHIVFEIPLLWCDFFALTFSSFWLNFEIRQRKTQSILCWWATNTIHWRKNTGINKFSVFKPASKNENVLLA